jgi:hypothetical protein
MGSIKISELPLITSPLSGGEQLPVVQSGITKSSNLSSFVNFLAETFVDKSAFDAFAESLEQEHTAASDFGIQSNNIQIKGELTPLSGGTTINVYTAVFVSNTQGKSVDDPIVGSVSNKQGIIKSIDSSRNILYIKENLVTANLNFIVGEFLGESQIISLEDFSKTLKPSHTLKIFYATDNNLSTSQAAELPVNSLACFSISNNTQEVPTEVYTYSIAQFRLDNGKISNLLASSLPVTCSNVPPDQLNDNAYNRLIFRRASTNYGILIYRRVGTGPMQLIAVLGERELGLNTTGLSYNDIGGFSTTPWSDSVKDTATGVFNDIFYFPLFADTLNNNNKYKILGGFTSKVGVSAIQGKNTIVLNTALYTNTTALDIFIDNSEFFNSSGELVGGFTKAARDIANGVTGKLNLPAGIYYTSSINLSSYFNIEGEAKNLSLIKTIPCNFRDVNGSCIFNCKNTERVVIKNLTLDGNYANNIGSSVFTKNFLINAENTSFLTLDSLNIQNSVGGGIYAPESRNLRLISNDINNGSLDLLVDQKLTALYAPQSEELLIAGNNFEGWVGPLDITATRTGVAANNIIKNCGTGLLVYGSTSLTVSPNIIVGINNESIPIVDIHDDNFDSININLEEGDVYTSDIISYLRDGEKAWLSSEEKIRGTTIIDGTDVILRTQIKALVKLNNQEYLLPGSTLDYSAYDNGIPSISIVSTQSQLKEGMVQFKLTTDAVNSLPSYGSLLLQYQNLSSRPVGEKLIGLVYKITGEEYLFTEEPKILITSYRFTSNGVELTPDQSSIELISALSVNDIIYPINVASGITSFNKVELKVKSINTASSTPIIICDDTGIVVSDPLDTTITANDGGFIGIKNNFVISKGRINKS